MKERPFEILLSKGWGGKDGPLGTKKGAGKRNWKGPLIRRRIGVSGHTGGGNFLGLGTKRTAKYIRYKYSWSMKTREEGGRKKGSNNRGGGAKKSIEILEVNCGGAELRVRGSKGVSNSLGVNQGVAGGTSREGPKWD